MLVDILCNSTLVSPLSTSGNKRNWSIGSMNISLTTLNSFIQLNFNQWIAVANCKKGSISIKKIMPSWVPKESSWLYFLGIIPKALPFFKQISNPFAVSRPSSIHLSETKTFYPWAGKENFLCFPIFFHTLGWQKNSGSMSVSTSH